MKYDVHYTIFATDAIRNSITAVIDSEIGVTANFSNITRLLWDMDNSNSSISMTRWEISDLIEDE
jgi:hypothetical protein